MCHWMMNDIIYIHQVRQEDHRFMRVSALKKKRATYVVVASRHLGMG